MSVASSRWSCSAFAARSGSCAAHASSSSTSSSSCRSCSAPFGEQHGPVALARVPRRADQPQEPRRPRRLVEREVERSVRAHRRADVAAPARLVVRGQVRARRLRRRRPSKQLGRAPHRHALEREPDREELAQLLDVEAHHLRAVVRHVLGEPERLELPHRLADRRDAHPEPAGEILEPQRRPRRQLAHDDRLAQPLQRGLRHRPVTDGGACGDLIGASPPTRTLNHT